LPKIEGDLAEALCVLRDVRLNASGKAMDLVKSFIDHITDEHHSVINAMLREENRLFVDVRRQAIFQLIDSFRKGLA
jgi:hypothetical protein